MVMRGWLGVGRDRPSSGGEQERPDPETDRAAFAILARNPLPNSKMALKRWLESLGVIFRWVTPLGDCWAVDSAARA